MQLYLEFASIFDHVVVLLTTTDTRYARVCLLFLFRSLSYVMAMASMAFLLLSVLYIIIDVKCLWNGAPFIYPGIYITCARASGSCSLFYLTFIDLCVWFMLYIVQVGISKNRLCISVLRTKCDLLFCTWRKGTSALRKILYMMLLH